MVFSCEDLESLSPAHALLETTEWTNHPPNPTSVEEIKYTKALPVRPPIFSPRSSLPAHLHRKYVKPSLRHATSYCDIILRHHT
jgi:hypothetical protein